MNVQKMDANILDEPTDSRTLPVQGTNGAPVDDTTEESNLDELRDFKPVPPRRVVTISIRYRHVGRGQPLPYRLDEDGEE
jgi:hypothetical protein